VTSVPTDSRWSKVLMVVVTAVIVFGLIASAFASPVVQ
jgi:hypothetical protein